MAIAKVSGASQNLIRTSVPNLISGVSQQADAFKLSSQASEQINAISSVVHGLVKRPGTDWIRNLDYGANVVPVSYHWINRGNGERYIAVLLNNTSTSAKTMRIFDLAGNEQTFYEYTAGSTLTNYFSGATANSVKSLTIADYTFFVNSNKVVAKSADLTPRAFSGSTQVYQGMIVVKQGYAGRDRNNPSGKITWNYKIVSKAGVTFATGTGNSGTGHVSDPSGGTDGFDAFKATDGGNTPVAIAKALVAGLSVTAGTAFATGNYRIFSEGSNVYIQHESVDFDIVTDDGYGQTLFYAIKDEVQNFSDLPSIAPHKFITKIAGLPEDTGDEYYVSHNSAVKSVYSPSGSSDTSTPKGVLGISDGVWEEVVAPGIQYKFDTATMPHALVKIASGKFLFTPLNGDNAQSYGGTAYTSSQAWANRVAGDEDSNPFPSFINKKITNLFFYKNRLGLLSGENVILSESGEFFNFFRTTLTQLLDTDVIDVTSSTTEVGTLYHAVPFYDRLVLFADKVQFSLQSDGELTPKNVSLQQTTSFDLNSNCAPKAVGTKIVFAFDRSGSYTGIQEYFINPDTALLDGVDITSNLTTYLAGSATSIAGSETDNMVLTIGNQNQNEMGVYKFFYSGNEKVQSAWSKFDFGSGAVVEAVEIFDSKVYLVISRGTSRSMEFMDLDIDKVSPNTGATTAEGVVAPFRIHLDKKTTGLTAVFGESGTISDNGLSTVWQVFNVVTPLAGSPTWSSGTNTSSSGYFKVPASEFVVTASGVTYQGYRVYRNASTGVLQFTSGGVLQPSQIIIKSIASASSLSCGVVYEMKYNLSQPVLRATAGRGQSAVADGRLQIKNGILLYSNSRFFQIKVTPKYKDTYTYTYLYNFVPNYLGVGPTNLDYVNFEEGTFKFPVFTKADEMNVLIANNSPYGCSLLSLEWEALYSARSKRIG
jgi:hypothetical protein